MSEIELPRLEGEPSSNPDDPGYNPYEDPNSVWYGVSPDFRPRAERPVPSLKCVHIKKDGERCRRYARRGTGLTAGSKPLCPKHGGNLPNVKNHAAKIVDAARLAIADSVPDAVNRIVYLVNTDGVPESVQLKAATEILDRAGVKGGADMTVDVNVNHVSASDKLAEKLSSLRKPEELEDLGEVDEAQ